MDVFTLVIKKNRHYIYSVKSNNMKTTIQKSSAVFQSFKQIVTLLVESFESPQAKQFKRLKSFISE